MRKQKNIRVALISPPYGNEKLILFSLPYLINGLRQRHKDVDFKIFDCSAYLYTEDELMNLLENYKPDIVGVSLPFTIMLDSALKTIFNCRKLFPDAWYIAGGMHAVLNPADLVDYCDYVVTGDGEEPFSQIINAYKKNKKLYDIPDTAFINKDGEIVKNPSCSNEEVKMGTPDWDHLDLTPFLNPIIYGTKKKGFSIFASKGCVYDCSYCSNGILWGRKIIYRELDDVFSEIKWLQKKYKVEQIVLEDDLFTIDTDLVNKFCDRIEKDKLKFDWAFQTRPALIKSKELLERMKSVGAVACNLGIESGSDKVLKANKTENVKRIETAVEIIKSTGLKIYSGFIIGFPQDDIHTVWDTITFPDKLGIDSPGFQIMIPYPGTAVRTEVEKSGGILTNDFSKYTTYGVVYVPPKLKGYDLVGIRKFAFHYFHTRTKKRLNNWLNRFEEKDNFDQIKEKFTNMYNEREMYNKDYLMNLKYDSSKTQNLERLPIS